MKKQTQGPTRLREWLPISSGGNSGKQVGCSGHRARRLGPSYLIDPKPCDHARRTDFTGTSTSASFLLLLPVMHMTQEQLMLPTAGRLATIHQLSSNKFVLWLPLVTLVPRHPRSGSLYHDLSFEPPSPTRRTDQMTFIRRMS